MTKIDIPSSPTLLGLPHLEWWENQREALTKLANSDAKMLLLTAPTGSGKSLLGMSLALAWESHKSVILCRSKLLQEQYRASFPGVTQMLTGKGNYPCLLPGVPPGTMVDKAPCNAGYQCSLRYGGCTYYDQVQRASMAQVVIANYPVWLLAANLETEMKAKFGKLDTLVCDEGHALVFGDEMDSLSSIELWPKTVNKFGFGPLYYYSDPGYYRAMAGKWLPLAQMMLEARKAEWDKEIATGSLSPDKIQELQELRFLSFAFERLFLIENPKDWIVDGPRKSSQQPPDGSEVEKWRVKLVPILGGDRKKLIYQHSRRVVVMSATLLPTPETAKFLGLDGDYLQMEIPSTFPLDNRPVYYWPVGRITRDTSEALMPALVARMDSIIEGNLPERGLIHATSFTMAQAVMERSRFKKYMRSHETRDRTKVAQEWLAGKGRPILVSPSLHEGLDAKDNSCRWQVILKVPWPDQGEPVWRARLNLDPSLYAYAAASGIVQMAGRAVRSPEDFAVTFLLDGTFTRLYSQHPGFFPKWFTDAVIWM